MKLLTLILTLFFFTACGSNNTPTNETPDTTETEDETNTTEGADQTSNTNESPPVAEGMTSRVFTCTGNSRTLSYEVNTASNQCNPSTAVCCEIFLSEDGGSPVLISRPDLYATFCTVGFPYALRNGGDLTSRLNNEHQDKRSLHIEMNCIENTQ